MRIRHLRPRVMSAAVCLAALAGLAGCSGGSGPASTQSDAPGAATSDAAASVGPAGTGNVAAVNALVAAEQPASAATVAANSVAAAIRARGTLVVGGTETAPLFSLLDPSTGQVSGFDAGLGQLLAKYIIGANRTRLVTVTADTREALLENHSVDVVLATYTITAARAKVVSFAGPYFMDGLGIAVRQNTSDISSPASLDGKTVVTESGSTVPAAIKAVAPTANVLLFDTDAECVQALEQGRAAAYVLDQGILAGDAITNPTIKVLGATFDAEPYGIGVPHNEPSFLAFVNTWLKQIEADGTWAKLWKATIGTAVAGQPPVPPAVG
jgi:glutamate transport system substrate-binding protein